MANDWPLKKLKDLGVAVIDCVHKTPKAQSDGIPYVGIPQMKNGSIDFDANPRLISEKDYLEWTIKANPSHGDIILSRRCNPGETAYVPKNAKFALGQNLVLLRPNPKTIHPGYLRWAVNSPIWWAEVNKYRNPGAVFDSLKCADIPNFEIPAPPYSAQITIDELLLALSDKIELNRQINQTLEQMAQTLFKSWFVDFDPVMDNALDAGNPIPGELQHRAEARKAVRESESFKPLPDDVRQLFPDAFEESELGWVPKGWGVSTAGDEFTVKGGSTPSTKSAEFWEGGDIHWTSPKDLSGKAEKILLDTERKITATGLNKITSGLLPPETVLMSSRAPVGYLAMTKIPVAINQGYIAITESKSLTQEFALYWLDSRIEMIKSISGGTTFAEISKKTFRTIPIVVPSAQSVNAFSETVALYLSKISKNVEECSSLSALRDSLLPKLISGELEIS
ncbi:restriction endonuclease subunit S [Vibrio parahaemolyticus]|uniref:restriction endonuclease subunit S n=2 Tax=Vibrio harveyi group TaxID=717610 RepID=UPI00084B77A5|nr:restriction endonuclease subunit S [Vibrio parahaemolyticus]MBM5007801.1 restriction endonuclease subunit S [Vibrio parahaemolyticus]MCQ9080227.1 restriction endonuclease subunit S [Vibrio parahaemolyticus]ODY21543.1 hypothetical protein BBM17_00595 [Vibrio parahaemolyticus]OKY29152.1 hypothetical protein BTU71_18960 [Vibrio parahaemolyticus]TOD76330.1 restriction endonuclease [Vibrio parahaemolyticus]